MRSLGMSEEELTECDMAVVGADNVNIKVLGAILVEFSLRNGSSKSKQIVYVCEGVAGALLSLEACIDLQLVSEKFPEPTAAQQCSAAQQKKDGCPCQCPIREVAPVPPNQIPFEPIKAGNRHRNVVWFYSQLRSTIIRCI